MPLKTTVGQATDLRSSFSFNFVHLIHWRILLSSLRVLTFAAAQKIARWTFERSMARLATTSMHVEAFSTGIEI
jgi:hypothetical protein